MSLRAIPISIGCVIAWFVLLPVLVIGGGVALLAYAIFAELLSLITGTQSKPLDTSAAREIVRRMCGGSGVPARNIRRHSSR
jgi:hypothetical protein